MRCTDRSFGLPSRSGWMSPGLFPLAMHTTCTKGGLILLLLENHESYVSIEAIRKTNESGMCLLIFSLSSQPPLAAIEVSVFGPLETPYNVACNDWLLNNPGKVLRSTTWRGSLHVHGIVQFNGHLWISEDGIFPFNNNPFTDEEYLMSSVTDRPEEPPSGPSLVSKHELLKHSCSFLINEPLNSKDIDVTKAMR